MDNIEEKNERSGKAYLNCHLISYIVDAKMQEISVFLEVYDDNAYFYFYFLNLERQKEKNRKWTNSLLSERVYI